MAGGRGATDGRRPWAGSRGGCAAPRSRRRWASPSTRASGRATGSGYAACIRPGTPVARATCVAWSASLSGCKVTDLLPDRATYGLPTYPEPVYAVAFDSQDLWGESDGPPWTVLLDLFDTDLEPA
jgi:hypothetical protein